MKWQKISIFKLNFFLTFSNFGKNVVIFFRQCLSLSFDKLRHKHCQRDPNGKKFQIADQEMDNFCHFKVFHNIFCCFAFFEEKQQLYSFFFTPLLRLIFNTYPAISLIKYITTLFLRIRNSLGWENLPSVFTIHESIYVWAH